MIPLLPPIRLEFETLGPQWGDLAYGPSSDQVAVSDRMRSMMEARGLGGLEGFEQVTITEWTCHDARAKKTVRPGYWLATVVRGRAVIDSMASGLVRDPPDVCPECHTGDTLKRARRIVIRSDTWFGEDIFIARGLPGTILVTDRFKDACEDDAMRNCYFSDAGSCGFDYYPLEKTGTPKLD